MPEVHAEVAAVSSPQDTEKNYKLLKQKLFLLDNLISRSGRVELMRAAGDHDVEELIDQAISKADEARTNFDNGDLILGNTCADDALTLLTSASNLHSRNKQSSEILRDRYSELLNSIEILTDLQAPDTDLEIREMLRSARESAGMGDYRTANAILNGAFNRAAATSANSYQRQTLVYSLNFENPQDEFQYEQERYANNRLLLDVINDRTSSDQQRGIIANLMREADAVNEQALESVDGGDMSAAIEILEQVNEKISRVVGMMQNM